MAQNTPSQTAKLAMALSLPLMLAACSTLEPTPPSVTASASLVQPRYDESGVTDKNLSANQSRAFIDPSNIRTDAPVEYRVIKGDTLWGISDRYLNEPWRWTEIWESNSQIENPHLIYPGDTIELQYVDGRPSILMTQARIASYGEPEISGTYSAAMGEPSLSGANSAAMGEPSLSGANTDATLKLDENGNPKPLFSDSRIRVSPTIRHESLKAAIPTISGEAILPFLVHPLVIDKDTLANAPYVIANDDNRLIASTGSRVYARGQMNPSQTDYGIYRITEELVDPTSGRLLGHELTHVADTKLLNLGDPSTLMITNSKREVVAGDILLASSLGNVVHQYKPRMPDLNGEGRVISLVDAISQAGRSQGIVLNMGTESNIRAGDVLAIETLGKPVIDTRIRSGQQKISMPNLRTGVVMVFKSFDKVSYALVMESTRPVRKNDIVTGI